MIFLLIPFVICQISFNDISTYTFRHLSDILWWNFYVYLFSSVRYPLKWTFYFYLIEIIQLQNYIIIRFVHTTYVSVYKKNPDWINHDQPINQSQSVSGPSMQCSLYYLNQTKPHTFYQSWNQNGWIFYFPLNYDKYQITIQHAKIQKQDNKITR